jgi:protein TonB
MSAKVTPAAEAAMAAAVDAIRDWRFEAPERLPASVLVRVRFAGETRQASVTGITAVSGYAPAPVLKAGGVIKPPKKILNVQPIYPQEAKDAKIEGVVIIDAIIDEGGGVKEAWVVRSVPRLDEAALDAVKQWRFEPTLMNGAPVPIQITTTVNFTLAP